MLHVTCSIDPWNKLDKKLARQFSRNEITIYFPCMYNINWRNEPKGPNEHLKLPADYHHIYFILNVY